MRIEIPSPSVVALVGASGSGKSTFAQKHFKPTEVLSSDIFRGLVSDDETDQQATPAAFDSLFYIANKRLDARKLTVIDATNVQIDSRKKILALAQEQHLFAVAIVFDVGEDLCIERNKQRPNRNFGVSVARGHIRELKRSIRHLKKEGFRYVYVLKNPAEADAVEIIRNKLWNDQTEDTGPFDIIGDIHGCYDELCTLLEKLNYRVDLETGTAAPPDHRKAVFLGDFCDRGPKNPQVLRLVMNMHEAGYAWCIPGNHDVKLLRYLRGAQVKPTHGLGLTIEQLAKEPPEFRERVITFIDGLVSHYLLDKGRLVVAHGGLKENLQGRSSGAVRSFCLYGETTGETDEFGLPVRLNWAEAYRGRALVVYAHTPSIEVQRLNNTICIDTGCAFGGKLTCFQYPEKELVQVPAQQVYYAPAKPLDYHEIPKDAENLLNITDILGEHVIKTRLYQNIPIQEESSAVTLEIISRFSADPHWLIYLPPTMAPCGTSTLEGYLEHPAEAFEYFKKQQVSQVICEEKHMGSRAVMVLCRDEETARNRFQVQEGSSGIIYTRTGRHFFDGGEAPYETAILDRLRSALTRSGFWEAFSTNWVCLDTELMPWSAKARQLLLEQYAAVGRAGRNALEAAIQSLRKTPVSVPSADPALAQAIPGTADIAGILKSFEYRKECLDLYTAAYRRYCWTVQSVEDFRIAPFHILATEGKVWNSETHLRHIAAVKEYLTGADPLFISTNHLPVDLTDEASVAAGIEWWVSLTESGGEGMVVKPLEFIAHHKNALIQPAVKCRGREYLRIIYGPEYTEPSRLDRLRRRSLHKKRRLALEEFALGMESLERFVRQEPLYRVHGCIFGVLALENETVDPRL